MPPPSPAELRFIRALLAVGHARLDDRGQYCVELSERVVRLNAAAAGALMSRGILERDDAGCRPAAPTGAWLKRQMLASDEFAGQHRELERLPDGSSINLRESPLMRLAAPSPGGGAPFLERHHLEAGERVRRLAERARMQPRLTMNYSAAHIQDKRVAGRPADIGSMAADARRELNQIHLVLPRDCAGVVFDVCGLLKGLQVVEQERGWPRRSAKLVLRIGLEQLAQHFGLSAQSIGPSGNRSRTWLAQGARPTRFE